MLVHEGGDVDRGLWPALGARPRRHGVPECACGDFLVVRLRRGGMIIVVGGHHRHRRLAGEVVGSICGGRFAANDRGGSLGPARNSAGTGGITAAVDQRADEVVAVEEGGGVDPFLLSVPAFDVRRLQEFLTHGGHGAFCGGKLVEVEFEFAGRDDEQFDGAFDECAARGGMEERAAAKEGLEGGAQLELFAAEDECEILDEPGWGIGADEELEDFSGDEAGAGGLLDDDVDDVTAVEVASASEEAFFAVVVG